MASTLPNLPTEDILRTSLRVFICVEFYCADSYILQYAVLNHL